MIRHGLVHQSPGYVCPFCPDREHKYPRPDNLQRYVTLESAKRREGHSTDKVFKGMFVYIMWTKTRMTLNYVMFLRSARKVAAEDDVDE